MLVLLKHYDIISAEMSLYIPGSMFILLKRLYVRQRDNLSIGRNMRQKLALIYFHENNPFMYKFLVYILKML